MFQFPTMNIFMYYKHVLIKTKIKIKRKLMNCNSKTTKPCKIDLGYRYCVSSAFHQIEDVADWQQISWAHPELSDQKVSLSSVRNQLLFIYLPFVVHHSSYPEPLVRRLGTAVVAVKVVSGTVAPLLPCSLWHESGADTELKHP